MRGGGGQSPLGRRLWAPLDFSLPGGCASSRLDHNSEFHVIEEGQASG